MRRRFALAGCCIVVLAAAAFGIDRASSRGSEATHSASPAPSGLLPPDIRTVADNPLTIAAMRARTYPASRLTTVRSDGDLGGYVNTVVSFLADGLTEYALMSTPDGPRPAAGWPVMVIAHGYTDPRTYRTDDGAYAQFMSTLARAGYLVLKPDYRGHGQSQGVPEGGYLSPVYAYDLLDLVSTLRADPRVDPDRIGMLGHSLGGYEVLRAMVVSTAIKTAVFLSAVVGSLYDIFYNWSTVTPTPTAPPPPVQQQVARSVIASNGTPRTNPTFWDEASPINYVSATAASVQIDEDVGDSQVPPLFSEHLDAALQAAGKTVQYIAYPGDDHQFRRNRTAVLGNLLAFCRAHL